MEESDALDDGNLVPINPIEEKDKQIAELEGKVESLHKSKSDMNLLKEQLLKTTAELTLLKNEHKTSLQKLNFTKYATEQRLLENISSTGCFYADPVLIGVYSATLDEEEFDFEEKNDTTEVDNERESRKDAFLKSIEEKLDPKNNEHKERFMEIKNKILEKVKTTKTSRVRSRSGSSVASRGSKRGRSADNSERSPTKPRTSCIPTKV